MAFNGYERFWRPRSWRLRSWRVLAAAGVLLAATAASCVLDDFRVEGVSAGGQGGMAGAGGDSGDGGLSEGGGSSVGGCTPTTWVGPPAASDPGPQDVSFVSAVREMAFGDRVVSAVQGSSVGFDLDERCTCNDDRPSCTAPRWINGPVCDGDNGIDNGFAGLVAAFADYQVTGETFAEGITNGLWTVLVRVSDYNGQPNDTSVTIAVYTGRSFAVDGCNAPMPMWDGQDRWPVDAESVLDPSSGAGGGPMGGAGGSAGGAGGGDCHDMPDPALQEPRYTALNAYVNNGRLVAFFDSLRVVPTAIVPPTEIAFDLRLSDAVLDATVSNDGGVWSLGAGLISGEWEIDEAFNGLSEAVKTGLPFCTNHPIYAPVKLGLCSQLDLSTNFGDACNALSFGASFTASPAQLGTVLPPTMPASCTANLDPANDSCDTAPML